MSTPPRRTGPRAAAALLGLVLPLGLVAGCSDDATPATAAATTAREAAGGNDAGGDSAGSLERAYDRVIRRALPSVVEIRTGSGLGSGVVWDDEGNIVTNAHVVGSATTFQVQFAQRAGAVPARLVGTYPPDDLAVIRVDGAGDLRPATFGDSGEVNAGDIVLAMGNPLGLSASVTNGIVSATGRVVSEPAGEGSLGTALPDAIQTSADINPGNSGGALVDLHGRVLGINTAMGTPEEGSVGIGYATPAWFVVPVVESILTHGEVRRGFLGVSIASLDDRWTASLGYGGASRAVVSYANSGSPAAAAGLQRGDVIERLDDQPVTRRHQVYNALGFRQPGTAVRLGIWRAGEQLEVAAVLGERPPENQR
jgi:putative serine protease PepD